jgi:GntR family transcriptional regulator/MocR family aminotransferase
MKRVSASFLPPIALDPDGDVPMYQQLSDWFRRAIVDGQLQPGQRVPSTRNLAGELKVSRLPVLSAYEQLHAEGYLETFVGAGTCVAAAIPQESLKPPRPKARRQPPQAPSPAGARRIARRVAGMRGPEQTWLDSQGAFRVGLPALDHFPIGVWSKLIARHARHPSVNDLAYGDAMGYAPLREAIAAYLSTVRAVHCDASQVLITTGSQQGLQVCSHVLLDPRDAVWMEEPGYPGAHQAMCSVDAQLVPVPVDLEGMDVAEGIRRAPGARVIYITPSHQFPLGVTLSAARRMQLLHWAARHDAWIIEDDYDSEYRLGGRPIASLQGLDVDARVIYVGTFSKVMFPSLRLGYMVVPKDLVSAFAAARDAIDTCSSTLHQQVMHDFIREGHFARHIRRTRMLYATRRAALLDAIHTYLPGRLEVIGAEAGMQLVALLPPGVDDVALSRKAATVGVSVRPLSPCYLSPPGRSGLILGYGGADERAIHSGIRQLAKAMG